jgi:hypothetical protein
MQHSQLHIYFSYLGILGILITVLKIAFSQQSRGAEMSPRGWHDMDGGGGEGGAGDGGLFFTSLITPQMPILKYYSHLLSVLLLPKNCRGE